MTGSGSSLRYSFSKDATVWTSVLLQGAQVFYYSMLEIGQFCQRESKKYFCIGNLSPTVDKCQHTPSLEQVSVLCIPAKGSSPLDVLLLILA